MEQERLPEARLTDLSEGEISEWLLQMSENVERWSQLGESLVAQSHLIVPGSEQILKAYFAACPVVSIILPTSLDNVFYEKARNIQNKVRSAKSKLVQHLASQGNRLHFSSAQLLRSLALVEKDASGEFRVLSVADGQTHSYTQYKVAPSLLSSLLSAVYRSQVQELIEDSGKDHISELNGFLMLVRLRSKLAISWTLLPEQIREFGQHPEILTTLLALRIMEQDPVNDAEIKVSQKLWDPALVEKFYSSAFKLKVPGEADPIYGEAAFRNHVLLQFADDLSRDLVAGRLNTSQLEFAKTFLNNLLENHDRRLFGWHWSSVSVDRDGPESFRLRHVLLMVAQRLHRAGAWDGRVGALYWHPLMARKLERPESYLDMTRDEQRKFIQPLTAEEYLKEIFAENPEGAALEELSKQTLSRWLPHNVSWRRSCLRLTRKALHALMP